MGDQTKPIIAALRNVAVAGNVNVNAVHSNWRNVCHPAQNEVVHEMNPATTATPEHNSQFNQNFSELPLETNLPEWRKTTRSIKSKLSYVLTHEAFQDVSFIVGKSQERIRAHKFMLLLASSEFEHMLSLSDGVIGIPDVDPAAFRHVLKFIYTDKFEIGPDLAMNSLYIAKKFDIPALAERCHELIKTSISENNVVSILEKAKELNEQELSATALGYLVRYFGQVINTENFFELSHESLCSILEMDELNVDELSLFQATLRWAEEQCRRDDLDGTPEDLRYELKRAISLIRFPLLTPEEFTIYVTPREILTDSEMLEMYKYFSISSSNRGTLPPIRFGTKKRSAGPKAPIYTVQRLQDIGHGPWGCSGKRWQLRFMVDRPIQVCGFGFYGSYDVENPKYNVEIYLDSPVGHTKAQATHVIQLQRKGGMFTVNFNEKVSLPPNSWCAAGFTFRGPNTSWGARQLTEVSMACGDKGMVSFRFDDGDSKPGSYGQANYQLPQILFTL